MNQDIQRKSMLYPMDEKGKIVEILNKDDAFADDLEDKTLYGEYVSTYHNWISPEEQRKRVNHIENITNNNMS